MSYHLIHIPGLSDNPFAFNHAVKNNWSPMFTEHFFPMHWRDEEAFQPKLDRLIKFIDQLDEPGAKIALIGTSAGGSAALNALMARPDKIYRAVNVCGRLRAGVGVHPNLARAAARSISFSESVEMAEAREQSLDDQARAKIITIRPIWDEIVPTSTVPVDGARNMKIPTIFHALSIFITLKYYREAIENYLEPTAKS